MKQSTQGRIGLVTLVLALAGCGTGNDATSTTDGVGDGPDATTTTIDARASSTSSTALPTTTTTAPKEPSVVVPFLFGETPPARVVVQRAGGTVEIWDSGILATSFDQPTVIREVEGEVAALISGELVDLLDGQPLRQDVECPTLMSRPAVVLVLDQCVSSSWSYSEVRSGEEASPPIEYEELLDGEWVWFAERGGTSIHGQGDAEGNLYTIESDTGQDLIAADYASLPRLSNDGSKVAYVDHADPAAESHFVSPVVVVRDTETGEEVGRWVLDEPVTCLELSAEWLVACLGDPLDYPDGLQNQLAAINLSTGDVETVTTETRLFLPA